MITAAEIQSIDFNSNSCIVRIPFFETVNTLEPFTIEAKICIQPGIYNGYDIGDTVWVDFIDDIKGKPLVIGKIYKGSKIEDSLTGGAIHSSELAVANSAKLPKNTTFTDIDTNFNSISKIADSLKTIAEPLSQPKAISEKEELTNMLWIDKKPIYKKLFIWENYIAQNTEVKIGEIGSNIDMVTKIEKIMRNSTEPYWFADNYENPFYIKVASNGDVFIKSINENWTTPKLIVLIEYTKK